MSLWLYRWCSTKLNESSSTSDNLQAFLDASGNFGMKILLYNAIGVDILRQDTTQ